MVEHHRTLLRVIVLFILLGVSLPGVKTKGRPQDPPVETSPSPQALHSTQSLYLPVAIADFPWQSPFGTQANNSWLPGSIIYQRGVDLNVNWVRLGGRVSWRELQPNEGDSIKWTKLANFEKELRSLKEANLTPVVIINDFPRWSTVKPTSCGAIKEDKLPAFAAFVSALVSRYKSPEFNVHHWEIGNEPDIDPSLVPQDFIIGCWGDIKDPYYGGEVYGKMLTVVGPAIRTADPSATIWMGGLLLGLPNTTDPNKGKPELFFEGILKAGAAPHFDILPYHRYPAYTNQVVDEDLSGSWRAWGGGTVGKARFLRQIMARYGVEKPVFVNETSLMCISKEYCEPPTKKFFDMQANHLVRSYVRGLSEGISGYIWYTLNGPGWRYTGLLTEAGTPRPAYFAYKVLIRQLDQARFRSKLNYSSAIEGYAFTKGAYDIQVVWSIEDDTHTVSIPKNKYIQAYTRDGKLVTPVERNGNMEILIGFTPIYIHKIR